MNTFKISHILKLDPNSLKSAQVFYFQISSIQCHQSDSPVQNSV